MSVPMRKPTSIASKKSNEPEEIKRSSTEFIPLRYLFVDPLVQRNLNPGWAHELARDFDPDYVGVVHVSERGDGRYSIVDGQHRVAAVRQLFGDEDQRIECKVYRGLSPKEEAALFVALNDFRRPTVTQRFLKNVVAGDPEAVEINDIAKRCGYKIATTGADGCITCVSTLTAIYHGFVTARNAAANPGLLTQTLTVAHNAWGDSKDGVNGTVVEGIARLIAARAKQLDFADLCHKLGQFPGGPTGLLGRARGLAAVAGGKIPSAVADVIVDIYNKGRRQNKIEPLRR